MPRRLLIAAKTGPLAAACPAQSTASPALARGISFCAGCAVTGSHHNNLCGAGTAALIASPQNTPFRPLTARFTIARAGSVGFTSGWVRTA